MCSLQAISEDDTFETDNYPEEDGNICLLDEDYPVRIELKIVPADDQQPALTYLGVKFVLNSMLNFLETWHEFGWVPSFRIELSYPRLESEEMGYYKGTFRVLQANTKTS